MIALVYLSLVGLVASFPSSSRIVKAMEAAFLRLITLILPISSVPVGWIFLGEAPAPAEMP